MNYTMLGKKEFRKGRKGQQAYADYLEELLKDEDVSIFNNPLNMQGVDIIVKDKNGKPLRAFEVTNYSKKSYLDHSRATRYIDSLLFWRLAYPTIYLALVVSYPQNIDKIGGVRRRFQNANIEVIVFKETP